MLDIMLEDLDMTDRVDKLQQLVFHLQKMPGLVNNVSANYLFKMSDDTLATLVHSDEEIEQGERTLAYDQYYALVATKFNTEENSTMKCNKCGHGGVEWNVKQTRSADEGSTVFCECKNKACRARWKM
jgi:DNA-directed RNA polymerase subunit M/transcription elongation factor TFIIS